MSDTKNASRPHSKNKPAISHRFAFSTLQTDNTGVSYEDMKLFDHSEVTPEEEARVARDYYRFEDFLNDPHRVIRAKASFRLFKRGNRLLAVEWVQRGWWESRYFAPRLRRRKSDERLSKN